MHILAITTLAKNSPSPAIEDHLEALRAHNVTFDMLYIDKGDKRGYLRALWTVFRTMFQAKRYDIIHAFYGHCGMIARCQFRSPVIVTFQGSDLLGGVDQTMHAKDGMIGRFVARIVDSIIVMTEQMKRISKREDAFVIPFGIETKIFHPCPQPQAREMLNLPLDSKLVLFPWDPARVEKNYYIAEEAVSILCAQGVNAQLVPVFAKPREEVALYMNACDVLIMVSDHEGSPVAVREAMGCGLPIVTVDVGDVAPFIQEVEGCFLCTWTPQDAAEKLSQVFRRNARITAPSIVEKDVQWAAHRIMQVYNRTLKMPV